MKTKTLKKVMCLMLLALGVMAFQPAANAGYIQLFIDDGVNPAINVVDGDVNDTNPLVGAVGFSYFNLADPLNPWFIESSTGITYNIQGSVSTPILHFDVLATSNAGGVLQVGVKATDYVGPNGWIFSASGLAVTDVSLDALYDGNNDGTNPGYTNVIGSISLGAPGGTFETFGDVPDIDLAFAVPYALGINSLIYHDGAGTTSFNAELTAVPEPASLLLLGFGLLGLLGVRRFTH